MPDHKTVVTHVHAHPAFTYIHRRQLYFATPAAAAAAADNF